MLIHYRPRVFIDHNQKLLVSRGHDRNDPPAAYMHLYSPTTQGTSYNTDRQNALHIAASYSQTPIVELLCQSFPHVVNKSDYAGSTALHLASRAHPVPMAANLAVSTRTSNKAAEDTSTIDCLLAHGADVHAQDDKGDTCLHYASAWGNLKAVRALIQAGADPLTRNKAGWTPEYYSITVQAGVYYRNLVAEWEKRKAEDETRLRESRARGAAGVRLVAADDESDDVSFEDARDRAYSGGSQGTTSASGLGLNATRSDSWR
jgi:uncharacterized protein